MKVAGKLKSQAAILAKFVSGSLEERPASKPTSESTVLQNKSPESVPSNADIMAATKALKATQEQQAASLKAAEACLKASETLGNDMKAMWEEQQIRLATIASETEADRQLFREEINLKLDQLHNMESKL